jgi:hypothetical protein
VSAPPPPGYRYRGLIWPAALIVIGGIALLVNTDVISADRLYRLGDLWPLLLIVIGLELLITRAPLPPNVAAIAAVLILLLAAGGTIAYVAAGAAVPGGTQTMDRSASAGTLDHASLEVDVGGANLKIVGDDIGGDLFRAHIEYTGPAPGVSVDSTTGHVQISQSSGFHFLGPQHFVLAMTVSKNVRWAIAVHSGATSATYDFSKLKLQSLEDDTGASREDIALGTPTGKVPVTINGGALTVNMHRPAGTAAQVEVSGGAVSLTYDGRQQRAVGSLTAGATDSDYFAVRISGGACTVTMDTNQG